MATAAEINAALDAQGTGKKIRIVKEMHPSASATLFYCVAGTVRAGGAEWVETTTADTTAQQATTISTAMAS